MHNADDHRPDLLDRLSEFEIAGCTSRTLSGERMSTATSNCAGARKLPIVLHHFPTSAAYEILRKPADAYMRLNQYG